VLLTPLAVVTTEPTIGRQARVVEMEDMEVRTMQMEVEKVEVGQLEIGDMQARTKLI
jgi:hypothetical protein